MTDQLQHEFAAVVRAMLDWRNEHTQTGYISREDATPFVASLPEFWREPARVMACAGYYSCADTWLRNNAE